MKILAGSSNKLLATRLAIALNIKYIEPKITYFNDSEIKVEIQKSFHNEDIIIVQSTSKPVNDRLIELFLLVDAAKKAGANRIILVMPYFGYARQDNINSQNIIPAKLIADFLEKLGVNHAIIIDLHSNKIEKFFNIPVSNLEPINLYIPFLRTYSNFVIVAPDKGSINRVQKISNLLNIDSAYINKARDINNNCEMISITGSVEGKNCILIDDIIDSGETIVKAARFLKEHSALSVSAFITHAVLSVGSKNSILDLLENEANKEEFVGNMERSAAAYTLVREDASTGLTYKLPLEASYARGLIDNIFITDTIEASDLSTKFHIIPVLPIIVKELINILL